MKNKNLIILFLVLLILIYPLEKTYAQGLLDVIGEVGKRISDFFSNIANAIQSAGECFGNPFFCGMAILINIITWVFHQILWFFNLNIFAHLVDKASELDPFYITEKGAPAAVAWSILVGYGFIILVFSGLSVAYDWLFGQDATALRKIFIIIFVALIINFTFVGIQEAFKVIRSFEKGITNNQSEMIGTIMAASLWQKDPFQTINQIAETIKGNTTFKYLTQAILYLFIVAFDMGMFIILIVTLVLFIARYFYILALTAISPLAVASLTLPEFQTIPALRELFSGLRFAGEWFSRLVKWLLVVPIFVILVLLCNITKENILAQIGAGDLIQFIMLFLGFGFCYMGSLKVAVSLGGIAAAWAKGIATGFLLTVGGALTGIFLSAGKGKVGQIMTRVGKAVEEKVGVGGIFSWRSAVSQGIGRAIRERGERWIKERHEVDAEVAKLRVEDINEKLKRTTDPGQIANLTDQLTQLIQQFRDNAYVLKNINESIRNISSESAAKILTQKPFLQIMIDPQTSQTTKEAIAGLIGKVSSKDANTLISTQAFLQTAASQQAPEVIREATAGLIDKLRKSNFEARMNDVNWVQNLQNLSQEFINAVAERIEKDFKEGDVIDFMTDNARINAVRNLPQLRDKLNRASKGFLDAVINQNVNAAADALSKLSKNFWLQELGISNTIHQILQNRGFSQADIENTLLGAIKNADEETQEAILLRARSDSGQIKSILSNLFKPSPIVGPTGQPVLTPEQQRAQDIMKELSGRAQAIIKSPSF